MIEHCCFQGSRCLRKLTKGLLHSFLTRCDGVFCKRAVIWAPVVDSCEAQLECMHSGKFEPHTTRALT